MPGWMHHKLESKLLGELPTILDTTLKAESKEELNTWQEWKKRVKAGLKLNIRKTKVMASGPITSWQTEGKKVEAVTDFIFLGSRSLLVTVIAVTNWKMLAPWNQSYDKPRQHAIKQRHHFADKGPYSQSYGFSSSHVWMWELDPKEGWALMLSNRGVGENSWGSLWLQGD